MGRPPAELDERVRELFELTPFVTIPAAAHIIHAKPHQVEEAAKRLKVGPYAETPLPKGSTPATAEDGAGEPPESPPPTTPDQEGPLPPRPGRPRPYQPAEVEAIDPVPAGKVTDRMESAAGAAITEEVVDLTKKRARAEIQARVNIGEWTTAAYAEYARSLGFNHPVDMIQEAVSFWIQHRLTVPNLSIELARREAELAAWKQLAAPAEERAAMRREVFQTVMMAQLAGAPLSGEQIQSLVQSFLETVPIVSEERQLAAPG